MPDYEVFVRVDPKRTVNDPQGKSIEGGLHNLGFPEVSGLRAGKNMTYVVLDQANVHAARKRVDAHCRLLLANGVMETYRFTVRRLPTQAR